MPEAPMPEVGPVPMRNPMREGDGLGDGGG